MKKHIPLRMCMACREMKPKTELIRFVKTENTVVIDETNKHQSRGAYVCSSEECVKNLKKKHCLERFFGGECADAYEQLEKMFAREG